MLTHIGYETITKTDDSDNEYECSEILYYSFIEVGGGR